MGVSSIFSNYFEKGSLWGKNGSPTHFAKLVASQFWLGYISPHNLLLHFCIRIWKSSLCSSWGLESATNGGGEHFHASVENPQSKLEILTVWNGEGHVSKAMESDVELYLNQVRLFIAEQLSTNVSCSICLQWALWGERNSIQHVFIIPMLMLCLQLCPFSITY